MTEEVLQQLRARAGERPDDPEAQHALALALADLGQSEEAAEFFETACQLRPDKAAWHFNRALAWQNAGRTREAIAAYQQVVSLEPELAGAWINLAHAYKTHGELTHAEEAAQRSVELAPDEPGAYKALGSACWGLGDLEGAADAFDAARSLAPEDWPNQLNLANTLKDSGRLPAAIDLLRGAVAARPDWPEAHRDLAHALLLDGQFAEGWEENQWRWQTGGMERRQLAAPEWSGEPIEGRTILLHTEQGFGDAVQFVRYAPLVAGRGACVVLECQPELERLLGTVSGLDQVIVRGNELPVHDVHCPLMELPRLLGTTLQTIPGELPYLSAEGNAPAGGPLRVGLAWAGSQRALNNRSMAPEALAPLLDVPGIQWVSLQMNGTADLERLGWSTRVEDGTGSWNDFADTAAAMKQLHLVISVDTAVAHLAGALGLPCWLLLAHGADWRWLANREDSPWYPSMRLFRMASGEDWPAVIRRVRKALALKHAIARLDGPAH